MGSCVPSHDNKKGDVGVRNINIKQKTVNNRVKPALDI